MRDVEAEIEIVRLERDAFAQELYEINRYAATLAESRQGAVDQFYRLQEQLVKEVEARDYWVDRAATHLNEREYWVERAKYISKLQIELSEKLARLEKALREADLNMRIQDFLSTYDFV